MSAHTAGPHGHEHAHDDGDAHHDAHDDNDDHGEPPPPEPASPAWLPLLGGALFLLALLVFLVTQAGDDAHAAEAGTEGAATAEVPTPSPPADRPVRLPAPGGNAAPR